VPALASIWHTRFVPGHGRPDHAQHSTKSALLFMAAAADRAGAAVRAATAVAAGPGARWLRWVPAVVRYVLGMYAWVFGGEVAAVLVVDGESLTFIKQSTR